MNIARAFLEVLDQDPNRLAVCESKKSTSCGELKESIIDFSNYLCDSGLTPGDRVIIQVPNGADFAVTFIGTLLAGGVPILCEPRLGDEVYLSCILNPRSKWIIVHKLISRVNRVPGLRSLLRKCEIEMPPIPEHSELKRIDYPSCFKKKNGSDRFHIVDRLSDSDAVIIFTGGTTKYPKSVRLSHAALESYLKNISKVIENHLVANFLADTPQQILYAIRLEKTAYVTKGKTKKRARSVFELVTSGNIDSYFGSPYVWVEMMKCFQNQITCLPVSLKLILLGSAPVTPEFLSNLKKWLHPNTQIITIYGLTEVGPVCTATAEEKISWFRKEGDFLGTPLPGIRIEIDRTKDDTGEILVRSPSLYCISTLVKTMHF